MKSMLLSYAIFLIAGCTYDTEKEYFSETCKTDFSGFPDIPGWNFIEIPINDSIEGVKQIYFFEERTGLLFTNNAIWLTENEGAQWDKVYSSAIFNVDAISFIDQFHLFVAVSFQSDQYILKTNDGGKSWSEVFYQPAEKIKYLSFIDTLQGIATLYKSHSETYVARTSDGGLTWEEITGLSSSHATRPGVRLNPDGFGFAAGSEGEIHFTSDFAESWITVQTGFEHIFFMQFLDRDKGFVVDYQYLYKTVDGGNSWTRTSEYWPLWFHFFSPLDVISLQNIDSKFDFDVLLRCNAFFTSNDGGSTWMEGPPSVSIYLQYLNFVNDHLGYGLEYDNGYRIAKLYR